MAEDKTKGIDSISKPSTGSNLTKYWKDFFPNRGIKIFVYRGINQKLRGRNIFSKEDDISLIALEKIAEFEGIFGGEAYSNETLTVTEDKSIKELELNNIPQRSATAFLMDLKFNYREHNLYFTIDEPFVERDVDEEYLDIYTATTVPGTFKNYLTSLNQDQLRRVKEDSDEVTVGFNFSPAVLKNSLQSSKVSFVSDAYIKDIADKKDFEIESIEIEADHTTMFEFKNWIKTKGNLELAPGVTEEVDIDLQADKPFLPLQIQPYAKNGNVQFLIANFNKYNNMPYKYVQDIVNNDKTSVSRYILQEDKTDTTELWKKDLIDAINGMFKLSWAFSTGFEEYRILTGDDAGNIPAATKIAGLTIEYLQSKNLAPIEAIDSVLEKYKYKYPDKIETAEFIRARQLLCASSQWINSSYCIAKGNTEIHKMILDFYLDLNAKIEKQTEDISLKIGSLKYDFKQQVPNVIKTPVLKHGKTESNPWIEIIGRYVSIPEIDDPISITDVRTFPGDFNSDGTDMLKYFAGVDVTRTDQIMSLLVNEQTSIKTTKTFTSSVNTNWAYEPNVDERKRNRPYWEYWANNFMNARVLFTKDGYKADNKIYTSLIFNIVSNQIQFETVRSAIRQPYYVVDPNSAGFSMGHDRPQIQTEESFKILNALIPEGAYNIQITDPGTKIKHQYQGRYTFVRYENVLISYDMDVETNSIESDRIFYDKGTYEKFIMNYVEDSTIKRTLTLSDKHKRLDANGNVLSKPKWKSIQRLFFSFFLGNHIDIKINYSYTNDTGVKTNDSIKIPRITLPSKHDELRTKLGVRLGIGSLN